MTRICIFGAGAIGGYVGAALHEAGAEVSLVARGPHLFGTESREMMIICDELGDLPLTGFYGNGEICNDRFYGYTGVLTLFV